MKIIDFEKRGNVVRFSLANRDEEVWGDDWADSPYEHNAGPVYDRFVEEVTDFGFGYNVSVLEPCESYAGSYSKQDMQDRNIPCIIIASKYMLEQSDLPEWDWRDFGECLDHEISGLIKIYFGDDITEVEHKLIKLMEFEKDIPEGFRYTKFSQNKKTERKY